MPLEELIPILQMAVGPVILISGVGLLLLSMTNRYGRVIDRARALAGERRTASGAPRPAVVVQLDILARRARLVRAAIALATVSVLLAACLVIALFLAAFLGWAAAWPVAVLFTGCLGALIGALLLFLADVNVSLRAMQVEVDASAED